MCLNKYIVDIFTYIIYLHDTFAYTHTVSNVTYILDLLPIYCGTLCGSLWDIYIYRHLPLGHNGHNHGCELLMVPVMHIQVDIIP